MKEYTKFGILKYFLKGSILAFAMSIIANAFVTLFSTIFPQIFSFTVDCVLGSEPVPELFKGFVALIGGIEVLRRNLWIPALLIVGIAVMSALFNYGVIMLTNLANQIFMRRIQDRMFAHVQRLPLSWHSQNSTGDIIQRCTSDSSTILNFVSGQLIQAFRIIITMVLSVVFMFSMNVKLAAVASAFIPVIGVFSFRFNRYAHKYFKECDEQEGVLSAYAQENLTGVRVVRAFGRENAERNRFERQNTYYTNLWVKIEKSLSLFWASSDFLVGFQLLCIVVLGTVFCVDGEMTEGQLIAFISYNALLVNPMKMLGRIISNMSKVSVSLMRIAEVMNAREEVYGEYEGKISGEIEFKDVGFSYDEGKPVLKNINLHVPSGGSLGIVGSTGCGKSTLVNLIAGLYYPTEGEVFVGGRNILDIPPATLRKNVGIVLQEGYLYSRTVGENIALVADNATEEDIINAAKAACVHENIEGFANGYDTEVGEKGVTLSGGQKQRVSIARTLLREVPILIFDDSLSAVDGVTDAKIRQNLYENFGKVTVIIVAHRITTVMNCDNIIVMDDGKITECGTHEELLVKDGTYKKIFDVQFNDTEAADENG